MASECSFQRDNLDRRTLSLPAPASGAVPDPHSNLSAPEGWVDLNFALAAVPGTAPTPQALSTVLIFEVIKES